MRKELPRYEVDIVGRGDFVVKDRNDYHKTVAWTQTYKAACAIRDKLNLECPYTEVSPNKI